MTYTVYLLSMIRYLPLVLALPALTSCQRTLVFFEQTAFKLGISVNEEPPVPLEVTVGLKRRVVAISPPKKPLEQGSPMSEAVSLLSRFDVIYLPDEPPPTTAGAAAPGAAPAGTPSPGNPFGGTLKIISAFASGDAAVILARNTVAMAAVVEPRLFGAPITRDRLALPVLQRGAAILDAIDRIDDSTAIALAANPPTAVDTMPNVAATVDPNNQRGANAVVARRFLKALVPELPVSSYSVWEETLGIQ
jgi:hypothetical protein